MKKIFIIALAFAFTTSCSKNEEAPIVKNAEEIVVDFNLSSFDVQETPFSKVGQTTNTNVINNYRFYVYNQAGSLVKSEVVRNPNTTSEKLRFAFDKPGNYTAVLLAFNTDAPNYYANYSLLATASAYTYKWKSINYQDPWETWYTQEHYFDLPYYNDYFFVKRALVISKSDSVAMNAKRVTGRLELNFKDIVPVASNSNFAHVRITLENFPYGIKFGDLTPQNLGANQVIYLTQAQWNEFKNRPMVINCMPTTNPQIKFEFSDHFITDLFNNPTIKYTRIVNGFKIYQNTVTRLSGDVFINGDFNVSIDTDWNTTVEGNL